MLTVERAPELAAHVGEVAGHAGWRPLTQDMIDAFAALTGDTHWIHTDPDRARREGPFQGTIAHGFLTLGLLTSSLHDCVEIRRASRYVNYGLDRVRFTHPVRPGERVRLQLRIAAVGEAAGAARITYGCELQIEGRDTPALRADLIVLVYDN
jgi:acyl dehydratase